MATEWNNTTGTGDALGTDVVFAANGRRSVLVVTCKTDAATDSPEAIMVSVDGSAASATNGIYLAPGDAVTISDQCPTAEIRAYSAGGTGTYIAQEGLR